MSEDTEPIGQHSYGWMPSLYDYRDHLYRAPAPLLSALPPKVDLSHPAIGFPWDPTLDQGRLGSCGPNAIAEDLVYAAVKQEGLTSVKLPSRLFIYWCTRSLMNTTASDSGVDNRSMMKALAQFGWCDEELWPYDVAKFRTKPPQECFDQAASRKIVQYLNVPQTVADMKGCIASGDPFTFGFTLWESFESKAAASTGRIPMPGYTERVLGGHDVLFVGYDDDSQCFKFKNSWGTSWGDAGYGYLPYAYAFNPGMASDFWTVRTAGLPIPQPVPPVPVPVPPTPVPVPPTPTPVPPTPAPPGIRTILVSGKILVDGKEI